jgi:hypothetical protein
MPRNKGTKKASFTPRVHTPAWVLEKIQRDTDEEARIAAKDSHPEPAVSPSSSSDKKPATIS